MRWVFSTFIAAHGIAHLVGFAVSWQLMRSAEVPFTTTLMNGRWDAGERGIRIVGVLWLVVAIAFVIAAAALATDTAWAWRALAMTTAASSGLCLVNLPAARIGLAVNLALAALLAGGARIGLGLVS